MKARALLLTALGAGCGGEPWPFPPASAPVARAAAEPGPPPELAARRELPVPGKPTGLLVTELDGAGWWELAACTRSPGRLVVWPGTATAIPIAEPPLAIEIGDYALGPVEAGGGSELLVAVASQETSELLWLALEEGELAVVGRAALPWPPRAIAGTRGDGRGAVAVAGDEGELLLFVRGEDAPQSVPIARGRPTLLAFTTGLGIAIGFQDRESIAYLGDPTLAPAPPEELALGGIPRGLATELSLGGGPDEASHLVAGGDRSLWFVDRAGEDRPLAARELAIPSDVPISVSSAALSGTGEREVVVLGFYNTSYTVLSELGREGGPRVDGPRYAGQSPWDSALVDVNDDSAPDLFVANRDARRIGVLLGDGERAPRGPWFHEAPKIPVGENPVAVGAGDLNGDGRTALDSLAAGVERLSIVLRTESGWASPKRVPTGPSPRALRVGDLDGDGCADLAYLSQRADDAVLALFRSTDGGLERVAIEAMPPMRSASDLALADFDGDGRAELVAADADGRALVRVSPSGRGTGSLDLPGRPLAIAPIDVDRDGRAEVAVALGGAARPAALVVVGLAGEPVLSGEIEIEDAGGPPLDLATGDLDGDGRADLVVLHLREGDLLNEGRVRILFGRDDGFEPGPVVTTGLAPQSVACVDLNGDGRDELCVAAQNSHHVELWLAGPEGSGVALRRLPDVGAGTGCHDLVAADLDGDGRPDLAVANAFSHDLSVVRNLTRPRE